MKSVYFVAVVICWLGLAETSAAQNKIDFSIGPYVSKGFGYTKWVMEQSGDLGGGVYGTIKSELEYPLNALYGGLEMRMSSSKAAFNSFPRWSLRLGIGTNLNDPSNIMKDHDWITIPGVFNEKISYTESSVKMSSITGAVEGELTLAHGKISRLGLYGGIRYRRFDQKLYDLSGWQLDSTLERDYFDVYHDTLVGKYKITYTMPFVGLSGALHLGPITTAEVRGAISIVFVSDEDDHVLRNRIATSSGSNIGLLGGAKLRFEPAPNQSRFRPFVELDADLTRVSAKPRQTIKWYGDDPITPDPLDDETGLVLANIPHHITSVQGYITAKVGLTF